MLRVQVLQREPIGTSARERGVARDEWNAHMHVWE